MLTNERRQMAEREIVQATIEAALKRGFKLHSVDNGEEDTLVSAWDWEIAMQYAFECDSAHVYFTCPDPGPRDHFAYLFIVLGNEGWTVISEYTMDLEDAVNDTEALVDKWEEEDAR